MLFPRLNQGRSLKKYIFYVVLILVGIFLFTTFNELSSIYDKLEKVSFITLFVNSCLVGLCMIVNGYLNYEVLRAFNVKLNTKEWVGLSFVNALSNYIMPLKTGVIVKAMYLKKHYKFDLSFSYSILLFSTIMGYSFLFLSSSILILFDSGIDLVMSSTKLKTSVILLLLAGLGMLFVLFFSKKINIKHPSSHKILSILFQTKQGIDHLSGRPRLFLFVILSNFLGNVLQIAIFYIAFLDIRENVSFSNVIMLNVASAVTTLANLVPGNLGINELVVSISASQLGISAEEGFIASSLIRISSIFIIFSVGLIFYKTLNIKPLFIDKNK